ncbi:hypothetical protein FO611_01130 [Riemerella anatipestifer]|uniref:hypothetical protein n=1 Tax=Riemerella anatipestifer TaxID=34085 RepID=UPI0012B1C1B6|nr:hypothetical protein [Riemerella anatipestifer]MDD1550144.1 hypothetical protein [Riemerella anatipestifer]MSN94126.1 hypothetical protein [Riemerella anatipestifer]
MSFIVDKSNYNVTYNLDTKKFTGDTTIRVNTSSNCILFSENRLPSVLFSGILDLNGISNPESTGKFLYSGGVIRCSVRVKKLFGIEWDYFTITLSVVSTEIKLNPEVVFFNISKTSAETDQKTIYITLPSNEDYSVIVPPFLTYTKVAEGIVLKTSPSSELEVGSYSDVVQIDQGGKKASITVNLRVTHFFSSELEDYNFCLDGRKLFFNKNAEKASVLKLKLNVNMLVERTPLSFKSEYLFPYFNDKCSIDIGEKINRYFKKYSVNLLNVNNVIDLIMHSAYVHIEALELDEYYTELSSEHLGGFKFFPGRKPKGYPLLTNHLNRRVFGDDKVLLSYITGKTDPADWGLMKPFENPFSDNMVACMRLTPSEMIFPAKKKIETVNYYKFPTPKHKINVQWLNQNLVPEFTAFTGEYEIDSAFQSVVARGVYAKHKKKFETTEEKTIKINTGFILKAERTMISELIASPFCFLELNDRYLKCIPISDKIKEEDSTLQLISFDLEMLIIEEVWK